MSRRSIEDRLIYFAGFGQQTADGIPHNRISHLSRVPQPDGFDIKDNYLFTFEGDGSVSRRLGQLRDGNGDLLRVRTYQVREEHSALTSNSNVLSAVDEVLQFGEMRGTSTRGSASAFGSIAEMDWNNPSALPDVEPRNDPKAAELWDKAHEKDKQQFESALLRTRRRAAVLEGVVSPERADLDSSIGPVPRDLGPEERELSERLLSDVLRIPGASTNAPAPTIGDPLSIGLHLSLDNVSVIGDRSLRTEDRADVPPIDAIAIGHYKGEKPQPGDPAWDLDQVLGRATSTPRPERRGPVAGL